MDHQQEEETAVESVESESELGYDADEDEDERSGYTSMSCSSISDDSHSSVRPVRQNSILLSDEIRRRSKRKTSLSRNRDMSSESINLSPYSFQVISLVHTYCQTQANQIQLQRHYLRARAGSAELSSDGFSSFFTSATEYSAQSSDSSGATRTPSSRDTQIDGNQCAARPRENSNKIITM